MRKNVLVHKCGNDGRDGGWCGCRSYITGEEAALLVSEGVAEYRFRAGAPGRLKLDGRAIVITKVPRIQPVQMIGPREIERACIEGRRYDSRRIELFNPRNPDAVGSCHGLEEVKYGE
jgi:hypothetical protein